MKIHVLKYVPHNERGRDKTPGKGDSPRQSVETTTQIPKPRTSDRSRYSLKMQTAIEPTSPTAQPALKKEAIDPLGLLINQHSKGDEEIKTIQKKLEKIPFFQSLEEQLTLLNDKEAYYNVLRSLKYQTHDSGHIVFKEKGVSDGNLYIVHIGSVGIFTKSMDKYKLYHPKSTILDKDAIQNFNINFPKDEEELDDISFFQNDLSNELEDSIMIESCNKIETEGDQNRLPSAIPKASARAVSRLSKRSIRDISPLVNSRERSAKCLTMNTQQSQNESGDEGSPKNSNLITTNVAFFDRRGSEQFMITSARQRSSSFANINRLPLSKHMSAKDTKKKPEVPGKYGKFVEVISHHHYFGERALQTTQKRYMTALTLEDTRLIILNSEDLAVAKKLMEKKKEALLQFISGQFPFLQNLPTDEVMSHITSTITEKTLAFKNSVCTEGQREDYFYLLYEGECELLRYISIEDNDPFNPINQMKKQFKKPLSKEIVKICNLQKGNFIGEEIIFSKEAKYLYTSRVTTYECKLLAFHRTKFLMKFNKEIVSELKKLHEIKQKTYTNLFASSLSVKGFTLNENKSLDDNQIEVTNNKEVAASQTHRQNFVKNLSSSSYSLQKFDVQKFKNSKIFRKQFELVAKAHIEASRSSKSTTPTQGSISQDKPKIFFQEINFERLPLGQIRDPQNMNKQRNESHKPEANPHSNGGSPTNNLAKMKKSMGLRTDIKDLGAYITPVMSPAARNANEGDENKAQKDEKLFARKTRYNTENAKSPRSLKFSFDDKKDKIAEAKEKLRLEKLQEKKSEPICKSGLDQVFIKFLESKVKEEKISNEKILKSYLCQELINQQQPSNNQPFLEIHAVKSMNKPQHEGSTSNIHLMRKSAHKLNNPFIRNNRTDVLKANNENVLASDTLPSTRHPLSASIYKTSMSNTRTMSASNIADKDLKTLDRAVTRA